MSTGTSRIRSSPRLRRAPRHGACRRPWRKWRRPVSALPGVRGARTGLNGWRGRLPARRRNWRWESRPVCSPSGSALGPSSTRAPPISTGDGSDTIRQTGDLVSRRGGVAGGRLSAGADWGGTGGRPGPSACWGPAYLFGSGPAGFGGRHWQGTFPRPDAQGLCLVAVGPQVGRAPGGAGPP